MDYKYEYIDIPEDLQSENMEYVSCLERDGFEFRPIKNDVRLSNHLTFDVIIKKNKKKSDYIEYIMFVEYNYIEMMTDVKYEDIDKNINKVQSFLTKLSGGAEKLIWDYLKEEYLIYRV